MDYFKRESFTELVQINTLVLTGFTMSCENWGGGGAGKVRGSVCVYCRPRTWEEEYRTIPGAGLSQESGRKWWKEPSAARVLGEVSRGCCLPGVLLDAAALGLTQVQWRSAWQACCLGRIPFFCIQSVSGGSFMFLPGMGAWDGPATFAGGIDLGCTKNISDSVPWSPWCQVTWGKQESEMGSLLLFASAQLTLCWALYLYILI